MSEPSIVEMPNVPRRPPLPDAVRLQRLFVRHGFNAMLFLCGVFAWVFKLKGDGSAEGGMLPFSPLQVLLPLLGLLSLVAFLTRSGGKFPQLLVAKRSALLFFLGVALIIFGAALHLRGGLPKETVMHIIRWLLPACFLLFYTLAREQGASPLALIIGLACGAIISAVSVEAVRTLGVGLPVASPLTGRESGYLNHPNQYGILCSTTAPVILLFYHSRHRLLSAVSLLLLPVWLVCLFQNLSKTNIPLFCVALLAGSLALALKNPRKLLGTFALVLGIAVFVASTATFALDTIQTISPKGMRMLEDAFLNPTESKTVDQRGVIWDTAINYLKDHPVVGLGPGKSLELLGIEHAHNALLQSFLDGGLPGFLGLCCVIIGVFLRVGELLRAEYFAAGKITDERMLPLLSSLGAATYVCANMMSDCFSTATMPAFIFFAVFAFSAAAEAPREAPVLRASARRRPGARRRPARRIPSDFDAD